jgi:hypothetical protein
MSLNALIDIASSNSYQFTGALTDDVVFYTTSETQNIHIGTKNNTNPSLFLSTSNISLTLQPATSNNAITFFTNNGANRAVSILGTGNVGINKQFPQYPLDVNGIINASALYVAGAPYIGSQWITNSNSTAITTTTYNIGIGTNAPNSLYKLDVNGTINATGLLINGSALSTATGGGFTLAGNGSTTACNVNIAGIVRFSSNVQNQITIEGDGVNDMSIMARQFGAGAGTDVAVAKIMFDGYTYTDQGSCDLRFFTMSNSTVAGNLTERMVINRFGYVGIGVSVPAYKLDVAGTINATAINIGGSALSTTIGGGFTAAATAITTTLCNVGIGTTSPNRPLDVAGIINSRLGLTVNPTNITGAINAIAASNIYTFLQSPVGSNVFYGGDIYTDNGFALGLDKTDKDANTKSKLKLTVGSGAGSFDTTLTRVTFDSVGNVGIGTTTPFCKLHVSEATNASVFLRLSASNSSLHSDLGVANTAGDFIIGSTKGDLCFKNFTGCNIRFGYGGTGTHAMTIDTTGNVGIGSLTPGYKLDVVGTINATTIIGAGSGITSLNMANAASGTLAVLRGGTGTTTSTGTGNNVLSASPTFTGLVLNTGNRYSVSQSGEARFHLYNNGGVAEWIIGQKTSTTHDFIISKIISGAETDYLTVSTTGTVTVGTLAATTITGAGSGITSLNMANAASGTLAVTRGGTGTTTSTGTGNVVLSASPTFTGTISAPALNTTGWVGIGTATPAGPVHVYPTGIFAGTVATTLSSPTVTGTGTAFLSTLASGDNITINAVSYTVLSVASDTSLTLTTNASAAVSGVAYSTTTTHDALTVLRNGNIGIGTKTPTTSLQVVGMITADNMNIAGTLTTVNITDTTIYSSNVTASNITSVGIITEQTQSLVTKYALSNHDAGAITAGTLPVIRGGTGVTTSTGTGNNVLSASPTFTGTITAAALTLSGTTTANGPIVVQGGTDGTSAKGIYMWLNADPNWGIYMAQSGAGKSLANAAAAAGAGFSAYGLRFRASSLATGGFIFENSVETALHSIRASDGLAYFAGNVGIGSTGPAYKLDVTGTGHFTGATQFDGTVSMGTVSTIAQLQMYGSSSAQTAIYANSDGKSYIQHNGDLFIGAIGTITIPRVLVQASSGNVGIGTITPLSKLHLSGTGVTQQLYFSATDAVTDGKHWGLGPNGVNFYGYTYNDANTASINWLQVIRSANTITSVSLPSGNVGIGTNAPARKLHVVGDVQFDNNIYLANQINVTGLHITKNTGGGAANISSVITSINGYTYDNNVTLASLSSAYDVIFKCGATEIMRCDGANNYVGIGIAAPISPLYVKSGTIADSTGQPSGTFAATIYQANNNAGSNGLLIKNNYALDTSSILEMGNDYTGGVYRPFYKLTGLGNHFMGSVNTPNLFTLSNSSVGIGTITPGATLHIKSDLGASAVPSIKLVNTNQFLDFHTNLPVTNFNSLVSAGDHAIIFSNGTSETGNLVIGPWSSSGPGMKILANGSVGIGTAAPAYKLHVCNTGADNYIRIQGDTAKGQGIEFFDTASRWVICKPVSSTNMNWFNGTANVMVLTAAGALTTIDDITAFGSVSDRKFKENIVSLINNLDIISQLRPVEFNWKNDIQNETYRGLHDYGLIAQELEEVIPEAVKDNEMNGDTYKSIKHERLLPFLIGAVQELQEENRLLREQNDALNFRLDKIEALLNA